MITKSENTFTKNNVQFIVNLHQHDYEDSLTLTVYYPNNAGNTTLHLTPTEAACLADAITKALP